MKKAIFLILAMIPLAVFSQETINVGTAPNTGGGDNLRNAFIKVNNNFSAIWDTAASHTERMTEAEVTVQVICSDTFLVASGTTDYLLLIGQALTGKNLTRVEAFYITSQGDKVPTVNVYRNRSSVEQTMTSTGANFTTNATINGSYDDVVTGDRIRIGWILGSGTTAPDGMAVQLTFKTVLP